MKQKSDKTPTGRLVEIDGITYQFIEGKLYRYADLTFDKGFKIVLGRPGSEEVLKHLLNSLLGTSIVHLEYRNTEHPGMTEEERSSRFDVYCEDETGSCFQVEMQNWSQKYFYKRAIYYSSLVLMDQAAKAQREYKETIGRQSITHTYRHTDMSTSRRRKNWETVQTSFSLTFMVSIRKRMSARRCRTSGCTVSRTCILF